MNSDTGLKIVVSGWKAAGISDAVRMGSKKLPPDAVRMGSKKLPPLDPFADIDPIVQTQNRREIVCIEGVSATEQQSDRVTAEIVDNSDDEAWEDPNDNRLGSLGEDILIDDEDE